MKKIILSLAVCSFAFATAQNAPQASADKKEAKTEMKCGDKKDGKACCKKSAKSCSEKKEEAKVTIDKKSTPNQ